MLKYRGWGSDGSPGTRCESLGAFGGTMPYKTGTVEAWNEKTKAILSSHLEYTIGKRAEEFVGPHPMFGHDPARTALIMSRGGEAEAGKG